MTTTWQNDFENAFMPNRPVPPLMLERGEVIQVTRTLFTLTRHGYTEEAYFTFTFSPLRDDTGAIGGILQPVVEVTDAVLAERRAATQRALAPRGHS